MSAGTVESRLMGGEPVRPTEVREWLEGHPGPALVVRRLHRQTPADPVPQEIAEFAPAEYLDRSFVTACLTSTTTVRGLGRNPALGESGRLGRACTWTVAEEGVDGLCRLSLLAELAGRELGVKASEALQRELLAGLNRLPERPSESRDLLKHPRRREFRVRDLCLTILNGCRGLPASFLQELADRALELDEDGRAHLLGLLAFHPETPREIQVRIAHTLPVGSPAYGMLATMDEVRDQAEVRSAVLARGSTGAVLTLLAQGCAPDEASAAVRRLVGEGAWRELLNLMRGRSFQHVRDVLSADDLRPALHTPMAELRRAALSCIGSTTRPLRPQKSSPPREPPGR